MQDDSVTVTISEDGQVSLPAEFLRRAGLEGEQTAVLRVEGRELRLRPVGAAPPTLRELFASHLTGRMMSSEEFITEKREEARREEAKFGDRNP